MERLRNIGKFLAFLVGMVWLATVLSYGVGVTRDHCVDLKTFQDTGERRVDSQWSFHFDSFPAAKDPAGLCVRNSPPREALNTIGIWQLPSPIDQVENHIESQSAELKK